MGNPTTEKRTTPGRLRSRTLAVLLLAAGLLTALTVTVADTQRGVHRVGREAAPQAQATSDLYFALSDLDFQTARVLLATGNDALSGPLLDAGVTFNSRLADVDSDLRQAIGGSSDPATQRTFQAMLDEVARYHALAGQAVVLDQQSPDTAPGKPATTALAYYSQATDLLHFELVPQAATLRQTFADELNQAQKSQHDNALRDEIVDVVVGVLLLGTLLTFQVSLKRRFGRTLNPLIALATAGTVLLLGAAMAMNAQQTSRLQTAVTQHMTPYLTIQQARAVAYRSTGDAIRYILAPNFGYQHDLTAATATLANGSGGSGTGLLAQGLAQADPAAAKTIETDWATVQGDMRKAMTAVDQGDVDTALAVSTGIARGETAFDFYDFDSRFGAVAAGQQAGFESVMSSARSGASGWAGLPAGVLVLVMVLVLAGVRPRLAEYR